MTEKESPSIFLRISLIEKKKTNLNVRF